MDTGLLDAHYRMTGQQAPDDWIRKALNKPKSAAPIDTTSGAKLAPGVLEKAAEVAAPLEKEAIESAPIESKPLPLAETPAPVAPARTGELVEPTQLLSDSVVQSGWSAAKTGETLTPKTTAKPKTSLNGLFTIEPGWTGTASATPSATPSAAEKTATPLAEKTATPMKLATPKEASPEVTGTIYGQLEQEFNALPENLQKGLWASEGLGSREKNMEAMATELARYGVSDLNDLQVIPRSIDEEAKIEVGSDGSMYLIEDQGEAVRRTALRPEQMEFIKAKPEYEALMKEPQGRGDNEGQTRQFTTLVPTGKQTGSLVNSRTGEVIDDNKDNSPLEQGFYIGRTSAGKGKTHFNLYPVSEVDAEGNVKTRFIPGTEYKATGFKKFMQDFGPALGMMGLFFGLPPVSAAMGATTAGTAMMTGLKAVNVAGALDSKNYLGAIAGAAGMAPGVNAVGNLGWTADTLKTVKNVGTAAGVANSAKRGDWLGAAVGGTGLAGGLIGESNPELAKSLIGANKTLQTVEQGKRVYDSARSGNTLDAISAAASGWK
jgi:hypothetical protein